MNATAAVPDSQPQVQAKLTLEMVDKIVTLDDPALRNLRVTLGYYDLSCRLARVLGYENANWCTFAVWASRHAGEYIRGEVPVMDRIFSYVERRENPEDAMILDAVAKHGATNPQSALSEQGMRNLRSRLRTIWLSKLEAKNYAGPAGIGNLFAMVFAAFGQATSHGNTRVFDDVAKTFVPFLDLLEKAKSADDKDIDLLLRKMSSYPARLGGQLELKKALQHYTLAKFEKDSDQRDRYMFVANGFVGLHEQTRLQDEIPLALSAPIDVASGEVVKLWTWLLWSHAPGTLAHKLAESKIGWMVDKIVRLNIIPAAAFLGSVAWGMFATSWMMALPLPDESLDLGANLPPLPDGSAYPKSLENCAIEKAGLGGFLHFVSFAYGDSLRGTAAMDWTSFIQRMNTIANLFRSRQKRQSLFRPPFTQAQTAVLRAPRSFQLPTGSLGGEVPPFSAEGLRELRTYRSP